ncbi:Uma2 family endonuclease [Anatilimnocola sp. NA78]|uniref:Uma2 family endonuclease n=1 Tax=Anatilimnocola sp. NA78 TaxID=3415683 RepID=UPI003CE5AF4C
MIIRSTNYLDSISESKRLLASSAGLRMSVSEFESMEDFEDGYRFELINGVVIVTPPASDAEMDPNGEFEFMLRYYKYHHPEGKSLDGTMMEREVKTSTGIRRVDRAIWTGLGRSPDSRSDVPSIIVEFVSPGKVAFVRDYEEKRDEYLELGCQEYWVIDRFRRKMTVFRADEQEVTVLETQAYTTRLLPGFELPLKRLLHLADQHPNS